MMRLPLLPLWIALLWLPGCKTTPDSETALTKADEHWREGEREKAITSLDRAIKSDKDNITLYTTKLGYLIEDKRYDEALEVLREAEKRIPDDPDLYQVLGKVHRTMGNKDKSERAYRKAIRGYTQRIQQSPWKEASLIKRAETYFFLGELDAALRDANQAKTVTYRDERVLLLIQDIERARRGEETEITDDMSRDDLFEP